MRAGTRTCQGDATWGACTGVVAPATEVCDNGLDEDCNGSADDGCTTATVCDPMAPGPACGAGQQCLPSTTGDTTCVAPTGLGTQYSTCTSDASCAAGFACIDTGQNTAYCMQWCTNTLQCPLLFDTCSGLTPSVYAGTLEPRRLLRRPGLNPLCYACGMSKDGSDDAAAVTVDEAGPSPGHHAALERVRERLLGRPREASKIGRYSILSVLGEGGMGIVYSVYDDQLDRRVALKLLKRPHEGPARVRALREAQAMARVSHPNVVAVFEVGEHEDELFVAMEHVHGETLREWQWAESPSWREVVDKYLQAGRGLAAAHAEGLIHRDFKPHNVIVGDDGRVRVLDFGLAARHGEPESISGPSGEVMSPQHSGLEAPLTETGTVVGTPAYMAPEQFCQTDFDHRADQFSFCVALWEALYGCRPFEGADGAALVVAVSEAEIREGEYSEAPKSIRTALRRGLAFEAAERWPDMPTLLRELERLASARSTRSRWIAAGAGLAVVGAVVAAGPIRRGIAGRAVEQCEAEAQTELDLFWNQQRRDALAEGITSSGLPSGQQTSEHAARWIDDFGQAWRTARAEACVATRVDEAWNRDDAARAAWCFDALRIEASTLVDALTQADRATAERAVTGAAGLSDARDCLNLTTLRRRPAPPAPQQQSRFVAAHETLSRARTLWVTAQYDESLEEAEAALQLGRALQSPSLVSAAQEVSGRGLEKDGRLRSGCTAARRGVLRRLEGPRPPKRSRSRMGAFPAVRPPTRPAATKAIRWGKLGELALSELELPAQHTLWGSHWHTMANAYAIAEDLRGARETYDRALPIQRAALTPNHPVVAYILIGRGNVQEQLAEHEAAITDYQEAAEILENAYGPEHPVVALPLGNLATAHTTMGKLDEAIAEYERALAIFDQAHGPDHPESTIHLEGLARAAGEAGDRERSLSLYERVVRIRESALGPSHPHVARALVPIGHIVSDRDPKRARELLGRAKSIYATSGGLDTLSGAFLLHGLAQLDERDENFEAALEAYQRVLEIQRTTLGADHPELSVALSDLGRIHARLGHDSQAQELLEDAVVRYDAMDRADAGEATARFELAKLWVKRDETSDRALAQAQRALDQMGASEAADSERAEALTAWIEQHRRSPP